MGELRCCSPSSLGHTRSDPGAPPGAEGTPVFRASQVDSGEAPKPGAREWVKTWSPGLTGSQGAGTVPGTQPHCPQEGTRDRATVIASARCTLSPSACASKRDTISQALFWNTHLVTLAVSLEDTQSPCYSHSIPGAHTHCHKHTVLEAHALALSQSPSRKQTVTL